MYGFILMGLAHFGHPPHLLSFPGFVIREFCFYILTFSFGHGSRRHGYGFANLSCGIPSFMFYFGHGHFSLHEKYSGKTQKIKGKTKTNFIWEAWETLSSSLCYLSRHIGGQFGRGYLSRKGVEFQKPNSNDWASDFPFPIFPPILVFIYFLFGFLGVFGKRGYGVKIDTIAFIRSLHICDLWS